jgi:hypothetical protein
VAKIQFHKAIVTYIMVGLISFVFFTKAVHTVVAHHENQVTHCDVQCKNAPHFHKGIENEDDHCFICDFSISDFNLSKVFVFPIKYHKSNFKIPTELVSFPDLSVFSTLFLRGPPHFS